MAKIVMPVLLVGCLMVAVVVAGAQECDGPYKGRRPTPEELETVLRNHQTWLKESPQKQDDVRRADLCQAILQGTNLQQANLRQANFQQASLQGADLQGANLQGANLQGVSLQGTNLQQASLQGANLQGASLQGANLQGINLQQASSPLGARAQECDGPYKGRRPTPEELETVLRNHQTWLKESPQKQDDVRRANLCQASLQRANLQGANLQGANLQGANLQGANLQQADLQGANLQGANLQGANLQGTNLQQASSPLGARCDGPKQDNARWANLCQASLQGANLQRANLQRANLQGVSLQGASLQGASLQGANLQGTNLQQASSPLGARAQECDGPYKGRRPTPEELETVLRNHQTWLKESPQKQDDVRRANLCQASLQGVSLQGASLQGANLQQASLQEANLQEANLQGADLQQASLQAFLQRANLQQANLQGANLQQAGLGEASLQGTNLREASLQGTNLQQANLQEANLHRANLHRAYLDRTILQRADLGAADLEGASLLDTDLQGASLSITNLQGTVYEPNPEKLPAFWYMTDPRNHLDKLVFENAPAGLIALREAFKKGGMRTQERQLTYAIEHTKQLQAWNRSLSVPGGKDTWAWREKLASKSESLFNYVLFELPSHYGMAPGRALWSLFGFIPCFALLYWLVLRHASNRSSLWIIVPADRLTRRRGHEKVVRIQPRTAKTWRGRLRNAYCLSRTCLYFSLLSAFSLGWREFNVGTWITRMQPREYTLRATGWVRTVSGIQSLLSVYLVALWVSTYFGRPFE